MPRGDAVQTPPSLCSTSKSTNHRTTRTPPARRVSAQTAAPWLAPAPVCRLLSPAGVVDVSPDIACKCRWR